MNAQSMGVISIPINISISEHQYDIVSVLGREEGYTVKYTPSPEGEWVYLTVYPELSPNKDSI